MLIQSQDLRGTFSLNVNLKFHSNLNDFSDCLGYYTNGKHVRSKKIQKNL